MLDHICPSHPRFCILIGLVYETWHTDYKNRPWQADKQIGRMVGWEGGRQAGMLAGLLNQ